MDTSTEQLQITMATTTATRKQSDAIRARMAQIRTDLPYDVDAARQQVRQLTDWKHQFRKHPFAVMSLAAVAGYLVVPAKTHAKHVKVISARPDDSSEETAVKKGLLGGLLATAATMALKSGTTILARHLSQSLMSGMSSQRGVTHSSTHNTSTEFPQSHRSGS